MDAVYHADGLQEDGNGFVGSFLEPEEQEADLSQDFQEWLNVVGVDSSAPKAVASAQTGQAPAAVACLNACDAAGDAHGPQLFPRALVVPGMLHILHNCTQSLDEHLPGWNEFSYALCLHGPGCACVSQLNLNWLALTRQLRFLPVRFMMIAPTR